MSEIFAQFVVLVMCAFGYYASWILAVKEDSWLKRLIDRFTDDTLVAADALIGLFEQENLEEWIERNAENYMHSINTTDPRDRMHDDGSSSLHGDLLRRRGNPEGL